MCITGTQQNKRVVKTSLTPEPLEGYELNRADAIAGLHKVVVSLGRIAAVVEKYDCLVHDLEH
ncbi:MAG: hypothetical protein QXS54_07035 [Candidatus Methanomethylicaceae archaeon]